MPKKEMSFENALDKLEEIVELLENGEAPLEKSLELFEQGVSLVRLCNQKIEKVESSVKILLNNNGELEEKDFIPDEK